MPKQETELHVLQSCCGEQVRVGPDITITILSLGQGKVRLSIQAPHNLSVDTPRLAEAAGELASDDKQYRSDFCPDEPKPLYDVFA